MPLIRAMEKNAWNGIAANSSTMRAIGGNRCGVGSMPTSTQKNSEPTARKWNSIATCPRWLLIRVGKRSVKYRP